MLQPLYHFRSFDDYIEIIQEVDSLGCLEVCNDQELEYFAGSRETFTYNMTCTVYVYARPGY